jgi:hypothetical protein
MRQSLPGLLVALSLLAAACGSATTAPSGAPPAQPSTTAAGAAPAAAQAPFPALQALDRQAAPLRPTAADLRYREIPWAADPAEALRQARAEHRPLFLWAAGGRGRDGNPLERC